MLVFVSLSKAFYGSKLLGFKIIKVQCYVLLMSDKIAQLRDLINHKLTEIKIYRHYYKGNWWIEKHN
jgi:hypothetical protein